MIVFPSEIHSFAYCPRKYFFELYIGRERSLLEKIRLFLGILFHKIKSIPDKMKGYNLEKSVTTIIGGVELRGRPDSFHYDSSNEKLVIIERKSGRSPRRGAWISDSLQVTAYGLMLRDLAETIELWVEYRDSRRFSRLDSEKVGLLLKIIDDLILVKYYGIVPAAKRSARRCSRCPFRTICEELDSVLEAEDLYEPGSILTKLNIDLSFKNRSVEPDLEKNPK